MKSAILIKGGRPLAGTVKVHGAKNSALPILAAALLAPGKSVIRNCPPLSDVNASLDILRHLGCTVEQDGDVIAVDASTLSRWDIPDGLMREMRSSVIFLGAVLGRTGQAELSFPGGCELGPRPIDLHLAAIRALGGVVREDGGRLRCAGGLTGREIIFTRPSVGATENAMLAAVAASGTTILCNAAREPEIVDLQNFLRTLGASVRGAGTSMVVIEGGKPLHGGEYTVMGDRIVAATYLAAAAAAGGEIAVSGVTPGHLATVCAVLAEAGCVLRQEGDVIHLASQGPLGGAKPVHTAPYPGFPTDAQPPLMAALARGTGITLFVEHIFDSRYRHVDELSRMGADIRVESRVAVVCGVPRLHGAAVEAADLRGGAALVVAALAAEGESRITGLKHLDRGYWNLEESLRGLGAEVVRRRLDS
ncbi:UDP-N-acetylglucosamine 1-carboxyvinyltransferase [Pseudoflavonifractor sp. 524-17]|uniref:UDP-N-acetylglucosamine 1-carboxyvinyltransferase n=1 Tax=Pseudoflavonifractor sp. 524-17 TaxID=2304577 RepID=UPI001379EB4B|nr:UDP-N-acetylglucosamine 1-carboxyvinyltransferase [Pseudoflavonifractor sp. 524-17]NCE63358.1 UDP-N-acetylglucosamine 1-carboxyvinyltransferase [Pseudoflavonifractor sp. 524-17]